MALALPERGTVIRYSYLWAQEHLRGSDEGRKDRPALVLALSVINENGQLHVLVLAIARPKQLSDAVLLPPETARVLGLDDAPAWVVTTEANSFIWPGPDIRPVPGRKPLSPFYGRIPAPLLTKLLAPIWPTRNARER